MNPPDTSARPMGLSHPGVLDAFAHDKRRDLLVLAMYESRPWNGNERQLQQLQEKLNAYASFILDGEMADAFPLIGRNGDPISRVGLTVMQVMGLTIEKWGTGSLQTAKPISEILV